jgi:hypothetical protein
LFDWFFFAILYRSRQNDTKLHINIFLKLGKIIQFPISYTYLKHLGIYENVK